MPSSQQEEYRRLKLQLALKQKQFAASAPSNTKASDGSKVMLTLKKSPHKIIRKNVTVTQKPFSTASNTVINCDKLVVRKKSEMTNCGSTKVNEIRDNSCIGNKSSAVGKKVTAASQMNPIKPKISENNSVESMLHNKIVKVSEGTGQVNNIDTELVSTIINSSKLPIEIMNKETNPKGNVLNALFEVKNPNDKAVSPNKNLEKSAGDSDFANGENGRNFVIQNSINEYTTVRETFLHKDDNELLKSPNSENVNRDDRDLMVDKSATALNSSSHLFQQKDSVILPFTTKVCIDKEMEISKNICENTGNVKYKLVNSEQDLLSKR